MLGKGPSVCTSPLAIGETGCRVDSCKDASFQQVGYGDDGCETDPQAPPDTFKNTGTHIQYRYDPYRHCEQSPTAAMCLGGWSGEFGRDQVHAEWSGQCVAMKTTGQASPWAIESFGRRFV
jgi:hypothetical protein